MPTMASTSEKPAGTRPNKPGRKPSEKKLAAQAAAAAAAQLQLAQANQPKIVHEEQILEAIDQLRRRKARPDSDRICAYLLRKFSVDARDTIADLHKLIESEKVIEVDYKGNTSYRNASKWTRLQLYKNRPEGFVKEKINSNMVANAFAELVVAEPDYLEAGVPAVRLVEHLLDGVSNPTSRRMVEDFLGKEVSSGNLARLASGNYSLVDGSNMSNGNTIVFTQQQNGDISSSTNSLNISSSKNLFELKKMDDMSIDDDRDTHYSNKTELENLRKEDCYEIIVGRRPPSIEEENRFKENNGKLSNGYSKDIMKQSSKSSNQEKDSKPAEAQVNHRKSKTERKQRLCVRSDDSSDLLFKYEDFAKESSYKDESKKDDRHNRFSEDEAGRSSTNPSPTPSNPNAGSFRSARRKRAKKVFDPSDNMVVKKKRGRHPKNFNNTQDQNDVSKTGPTKDSPNSKENVNRHCSLCSKDKQEALTACRDCTVRAHPSCIYTPEEMVLKVHTSWQCERCKTCVSCYETSEVGPLITCFSCDDAYHYSCHSPRITVPKSRWHCSECNRKRFKVSEKSTSSNCNWNNNNISTQLTSNTLIPPVLSPQVSPSRSTSDNAHHANNHVNNHVNNHANNNANNNSNNHANNETPEESIDPNIPDVTDWSSEQVYQYFARLFPKEAEVFRSQEIDGHSLLLLTRNNVLTKFRLLLGPALKIYRHVLKLQHRRDDPNLYWL